LAAGQNGLPEGEAAVVGRHEMMEQGVAARVPQPREGVLDEPGILEHAAGEADGGRVWREAIADIVDQGGNRAMKACGDFAGRRSGEHLADDPRHERPPIGNEQR
jgi:hypothetical protein